MSHYEAHRWIARKGNNAETASQATDMLLTRGVSFADELTAIELPETLLDDKMYLDHISPPPGTVSKEWLIDSTLYGNQIKWLRRLMRALQRADERKTMWVNCQSGSTFAAGTGAPSQLGSAMEANNTADTSYNKYTSQIGGVGGFAAASFAMMRMSHDPIYVAVITPDTDLADIKLWFGIATAAASAGSTNGPASHVLFRYQPSQGDTGWMASVRASSGTPVLTALGVVPVAGQKTVLVIRVDSTVGKAYFSINGGTETEVDVSAIASSLDVGYIANVVSEDGLGTKAVNISRVMIETN